MTEEAIETQDQEICPCRLKVVDGHIEADCLSKDEALRLQSLLEKEVVIRVKPKVAQAGE
jgi:hypothetical protein